MARQDAVIDSVSRVVLIASLICVTSSDGEAQGAGRGDPRLRPEIRTDYLTAPDAVHVGAGTAVRMGTYLRLAVIASAGPRLGDAADRFGWRGDMLGRFQLDPFRERRWAPYAAGGLSVRGSGGAVDEYLVLLAGVEGPLMRNWSPAFEIGLGGGARVGVVLRRGGGRWR